MELYSGAEGPVIKRIDTGGDIRRVDLVFGIGYDDDMPHATDVMMEIDGSNRKVWR